MSAARINRNYHERRSDQRQPYPYPIYLTPVADHSLEPIGEPIVVLGKHLSERGLDFYCHDPLPYRRMIATLEHGTSPVEFLLDLRWCRFNQHGWYENGGRFLQILQPRTTPGTPETPEMLMEAV